MKDFFPRIIRQQFKREEYVKFYADSALIFEPGSKYYYSSWGYFTLGYIMERVTGKSYSQLMKEDLFDKIGMTNSGSYLPYTGPYLREQRVMIIILAGMDFLSNQLLNLKRLEDARIVTDNNSIEFSNKDLVMVTRGNIYNALRRTEDAIKFYQKALALNPLYQEAKNRLKELSMK